MLARLKLGPTPGQLKRECDTIIGRNLERLPDARSLVESTGFTAGVVPILEETVADDPATGYRGWQPVSPRRDPRLGFDRLQQQDPGFDHASTLTAHLTLPPTK